MLYKKKNSDRHYDYSSIILLEYKKDIFGQKSTGSSMSLPVLPIKNRFYLNNLYSINFS